MVEVATLSPSCNVSEGSVLGGASAAADQHGLHLPIASSEFERVLEKGFGFLRFPPAMEAQYLQDKAAERLKLIRLSMVLVVVLFNSMLLSDWLMIPDQFRTAVLLRTVVFTPVAMLWLLSLKHVSSRSREWLRIGTSAGSAAITVYLCLASSDRLAPPYLVSLALVLLFNGGVVRVRFWPAICVALMVVAFFIFAVFNVNNPPVAILSAMGIALSATAVFTLYGCYWLEHEDRSNWLMVQHEHLLLSELDRANRQLDRISRFDSLTDLANRRHFDEFLAQVWGRAEQDREEMALLMIDIDHFKAYNDHYGHPAGDACLKQVASALTAYLRTPGDLVARFGGEEFVAVLTKTNLPMALAAAERVREGVALLGLPHAASPTSEHVTVSIGVASMAASSPHASPARLVAAADEALYRAKAGGRNRACHAGQPA